MTPCVALLFSVVKHGVFPGLSSDLSNVSPLPAWFFTEGLTTPFRPSGGSGNPIIELTLLPATGKGFSFLFAA